MKRLELPSWGSVSLASLLCGKLSTLQNPQSSCQQSVDFREPAFSSFQGANPADIMGWLGWALAAPFIFGGGRQRLPLSANNDTELSATAEATQIPDWKLWQCLSPFFADVWYGFSFMATSVESCQYESIEMITQLLVFILLILLIILIFM